VDAAVKIAREFGAQVVIGIGGGSSIDAAKSTAILMEYHDKTARDLCLFNFTPEKAAPIIAINLTHGTGTEVDRFAVVTIPEKEYKPALAYECIYPLYSIDDPALMTTLPANQTRYVSVDAVNHIIEAATSKAANPLAVLTAIETMRLIARYLPQALAHPEDLTARYYLLYASLIAGISFDNGLLHFTHALEHPLSAVKPDVIHGLGLGVLLPAIIKQIYPATPEVLAEILSPVVEGLKGVPAEAEKAAVGVRNWLNNIGLTERLSDLGFTENDVPRLVDLAFSTPSLDFLLSLAPIPADKKVVETIYRESL
jgi:alcohol dehydrogenase